MLEYAKKAVSYFMPNHCKVWGEHLKMGNPMHSDMVSMLLGVIWKREVQSQGQESPGRTKSTVILS